jgi:single-strand selective monofunctional uracil DNA glycosylase
LLAACDQALADLVTVLEPRVVIGVGAFAEQCARRALAGRSIAIGRIAHPSPASPVANRGWVTLIERQLEELGVLWS